MSDITNNNKRIAKNTLALFVRMCFIVVLGLVSSRFMLRYLGEVDFGIYNVVGGAVNLMGFFNVVLASATNRFLMVELGKGSEGNLSQVFTTSLQIHAAIGLAVILLGDTLGLYYICHWLNVPMNRMGDVQIVYQVSLFTCALCVLQVPYQGLLVTYENFTRFSIAQVVMMVGIFISSLTISLIEQHRLIWFSVMMAFSQLLGLLLYCLMARRYVPPLSRGFDRHKARSMIGFSAWIALGAASSMAKNQGSNVVLNYYFGPIVNSAFSIANQVNAQVSRMTENVSKSFSPQIMQMYEQNQRERMLNLVCASSKYSFFMLYLIAYPFFIKTSYILHLWLGDYPDYTVTFCHIIMANILLGALSQGISPAVQATGRIKWFQIVGSCVTLSSIPLSVLAFHFGAPPYLISIAFLVSAVFSVFLNFYMMNRILHFPVAQLVRGIYFRVLPVVFVTLPLMGLIDHCCDDTLQGLIFVFLISEVLIAVGIYTLGLTYKEKKLAISYLKTLLLEL